jgi:hypothetical protein
MGRTLSEYLKAVDAERDEIADALRETSLLGLEGPWVEPPRFIGRASVPNIIRPHPLEAFARGSDDQLNATASEARELYPLTVEEIQVEFFRNRWLFRIRNFPCYDARGVVVRTKGEIYTFEASTEESRAFDLTLPSVKVRRSLLDALQSGEDEIELEAIPHLEDV